MPRFLRPTLSDNEVKRLLDSLDGFVVPLEAIQFLDGRPLTSIVLGQGSNVIQHKLGRQPLGWWITRSYGDVGFQPHARFLHSQNHGSYGGYPSGSNLNLTLNWQPTSGNTLVGIITTNASSATASITQTGATWGQIATYNIGSGSRMEIWIAPNVAAPSTSIVYVPVTTYTNWAIVHAEFAGCLRAAAATVIDQSVGNTGTTSPAFGGGLTAAERNEWCLAGFSALSSYATFTNPRDGWALHGRAWGAGSRSVARVLSLAEKPSAPDGVEQEARADIDTAGEWICLQTLVKTEPVYSGFDYPIELARDDRELTLEVQIPRAVDLWVY